MIPEQVEEVELLEVTREDIAHGVRRSCEGCPIARAAERLAIRRGWLGGGAVRVTDGSILILPRPESGLPRRMAPCPEAAQDFIDAFDSRGQGAVKPITIVASFSTF